MASYVLAKINESDFDIVNGSISRSRSCEANSNTLHLLVMIASGSPESAASGRSAIHLETAPVSRPLVPEIVPANQSARKPRVLQIISPPAIRAEEVKGPVSLEPPAMPAIPRSQFARIRTLVKYGITVGQVAEVYQGPVGEIERLLRKA